MAKKYYGNVHYVTVCLFEIYGHVCNDTGTREIIYSCVIIRRCLYLYGVAGGVNLTFWPPSFTFNSNRQPDANIFQFIILTFVYSSTSFGRFPAHHQELNDCSASLWFYLRIVVIVVLCLWLGRS
jgi:hypothetical protein